MSATLNFYWAATVTESGITRQIGSLTRPVATNTIDGDLFDQLEFAIPASTTVTLWAYSTSKPDFVLAIIETDGAVDVELKLDKPTSSTDDTAATTYVNYQTIQVESHAPLVLSADQGKVDVNATAKNSSSIAGTQGKVYEIRVRAGAARNVKLTMIN